MTHRYWGLLGVAAVTAITSTCALFGPNIDYAIIDVTFPDPGSAQGAVSGTFVIINEGSEAGINLVTWSVYASEDETLDAADSLIQDGVIDALGAGVSSDPVAYAGTWPAIGGQIFVSSAWGRSTIGTPPTTPRSPPP